MDRSVFPRRSAALWLPLIYGFILSSRLPSQWLVGTFSSSASSYQDGNAIDRFVFTGLLVAGLWVLSRRPGGFGLLLRSYWLLAVFLGYAFASMAWSDFPFVTFKRLVRDLGLYTVICIVATEPDVSGSLRLVFRRLSYCLVLLSVLLVKYYPAMGRYFTEWSGEAMETGVATGKNTLGAVTLMCGLYLVWDCFANIRTSPRRARDLLINVVLLSLTMWLLWKSKSATSQISFLIGLSYLLLIYLTPGRLQARTLSRAFVALLLLYIPANYFLGLTDLVIESFGRDTTLTGRTEIWAAVIREVDNPLMGEGYESFWLGIRLKRLWAEFYWMPNQAHNGYLEIYLQLGWIGLLLLIVLLLSMYRDISRGLTNGPEFSRLAMAMLLPFISYNWTEAAFKAHPMWFAALLTALACKAQAAIDATQATTGSAVFRDVRHRRPPIAARARESAPVGAVSRIGRGRPSLADVTARWR